MFAWFHDYRVSSSKFMLNYVLVILLHPSILLQKTQNQQTRALENIWSGFIL